jgi:hypothetical protein
MVISITVVKTPRAERYRRVQINRKNNIRLGRALRLITDENIPVKVM